MDLTAKPRIEICDQDFIDDYAVEAREFFRGVLGLDFDSCLVTDESSLSDFCFSGAPDGALPAEGALHECYDAWYRWVLSEVSKQYDIDGIKPSIRLLALFERIRQNRNRCVN